VSGCGPGALAFRLHGLGVEVTGIEPNGPMLAAARRAALESEADIVFLQKTAEDITAADGPARLAVFGRSFHWTDRARVAAILDDVIEPQGGLVIVHEDSRTRNQTKIGQVVEALKRDWCPDGIPGADNRNDHEAVLRASPFRDVSTVHYPVTRHWSVDDAIGYMLSTSYFNPTALGGRAEMFKIDARSRLLEQEPSGLFEEQLAFRALYAVRGRD
jgi:hypothetical protein